MTFNSHSHSQDNEYYDLLGIKRDASTTEIKKAYRQLAKKYHPDRHSDKNEETRKKFSEKFKKISEAYSILSDNEKRETYNKFGKDGIDKSEFKFDVSDLFGNIFGFTSPGKTDRDVTIHKIHISLEEFYTGVTKKFKIERKILCKNCNGLGAMNPDDIQKCEYCNGRGSVMNMRQVGSGMIVQQLQKCDKCFGEGEMIHIHNKCHKCHGKKTSTETMIMKVEIPKGVQEGHKIFFKGKGHHLPGKSPGDIIFIIMQKTHSTFKRTNDNGLYMEKNITLYDALIGINFEIKYLDNTMIHVKYPDVIKPNQILKMCGKGMIPNNSDLYIKFIVEFPSKLNKEQRKTLQKMKLSQNKKLHLENDAITLTPV